MSKTKIYNTLVALSIILGKEQKKERLLYYAEHLSKFETEAVIAQIKGFGTTALYFPQLSEIIALLTPKKASDDELANVLASEIMECISKFGHYQVNEVREHLKEKFQLVERFGGWNYLCQITNSEIPIVRAQLRELARAYIARSKRENLEHFSAELAIEKGSLKKVGYETT